MVHSRSSSGTSNLYHGIGMERFATTPLAHLALVFQVISDANVFTPRFPRTPGDAKISDIELHGPEISPEPHNPCERSRRARNSKRKEISSVAAIGDRNIRRTVGIARYLSMGHQSIQLYLDDLRCHPEYD
jgi:hypothetical protein